jgi:hypothetical protein
LTGAIGRQLQQPPPEFIAPGAGLEEKGSGGAAKANVMAAQKLGRIEINLLHLNRGIGDSSPKKASMLAIRLPTIPLRRLLKRYGVES